MLASPERKGLSQATAPSARCGSCRERPPAGPQQQLGANRGRTQLRMREPKIVSALCHVVREFIAEHEAEADRVSFGIDQVNTGDFRFLAAILREVRHDKRLAGRYQ